MALSPGDPNSFSRPDLVVVTHTHMQLKVDFEKSILTGNVILDVEKKKDADCLILDVRGLVLLSIINVIDGNNLDYTVNETVAFGSKLSIKLPPSCDNARFKIKINYHTQPNSTALQWMKPEQTAGGKLPYLYSQCQAIHARSMLPCQDTPSAKATYSAEISVPAELTVIMSALRDEVRNAENSTKIYTFHQPVPIPSYLIAIAVGALVSKKIGPRSHVWSEKEHIDESAYEFAKTEDMLQVAESICGPYIWGIYDLLILPPSFPFGGMENPCLTFVTPTLLAGDRSLTDVIAHEISHSWTGNLVTNANFEHFWLNEGFTRFVEEKINGKMHGEAYRQFTADLGLVALRETVNTLGEKNQLTNLIPNLNGIDPDDSFSSVPYEKGHSFLFYLEQLLGGAEKFDPFLRSYLDKFKYKSIVSTDWKAYLYEYFADKKDLLDTVDWEAWFYNPGMPPVIPKYDQTYKMVCIELAKRCISWNENEPCPFSTTDVEKLMPLQKVSFLNQLFESNDKLSIDKLKVLMETCGLSSNKNAEIRFIWLRLCIKNRWEAKVDDALRFVTEVGRMKYVRPIYRDLYDWPEVRQRAIDNYNRTKDKMMYVTAKMVAKDLHLDK